jgi:hypothetical protein
MDTAIKNEFIECVDSVIFSEAKVHCDFSMSNKPQQSYLCTLYIVAHLVHCFSSSDVHFFLMTLSNNFQTSLLLHSSNASTGSVSSSPHLGGLLDSPTSGNDGESWSLLPYLKHPAACPSPTTGSYSFLETPVNSMYSSLMVLIVIDVSMQGVSGKVTRVCDTCTSHVCENTFNQFTLISWLSMNGEITN